MAESGNFSPKQHFYGLEEIMRKKISRRNFLKGSMAAGLTAASLGFPTFLRKAHAVAPTVLKFGTYEPAQAFLPVKVFIPWVEKINKAGEGILKIELYTNGVLGPDPTQQLKMIVDGVADITSSGMAYAPGRFPESVVTNVPFIATNLLDASIALRSMHEKKAFSGFGDILALCMVAQPPYYLHTTKPCAMPADIKGLKIRTAGKMQQDLIAATGGTPVAESISKVAENISRNNMQGTVGEWMGMETYRVVDVAKCHTYANFGTNAFPVLMNKRKFESMPKEAQDMLMKHSDMELLLPYCYEWEKFNDEVETRLRNDPTHTHIDLNAEQTEVWKKAFDSATQGWLKTNPKFPGILDMYKEEVAKAREYIKANNLGYKKG
jgi:TRAP-type C4-dicarboxylate transport system substrate-binding protein